MISFDFSIGDEGGSTRMKFVLGPRVGAFLVQLRKTRYQSRFIPPRAQLPQPWRVLLRVMGGELRLGGVILAEGAWACVSDSVFVPSPEGPSVLAVVDADVDLIAIRVRAERVAPAWGTVEIIEASAETEAAHAAFAPRLEEVSDVDQGFIDGLRSLLRAFERERWLTGSVGDLRVNPDDAARLRVQRALSAALSHLGNNPTMLDLIEEAGVTERQMLRDLTSVQQRFAMFEGGWRETLRWWRLTAAVFLLGNRDRSISEVARATGYSDSSALGRAFRDMRFTAPTQIKKALAARQMP